MSRWRYYCMIVQLSRSVGQQLVTVEKFVSFYFIKFQSHLTMSTFDPERTKSKQWYCREETLIGVNSRIVFVI